MKKRKTAPLLYFFLSLMFFIAFWVNFSQFREETGAGALLFFALAAIAFFVGGVKRILEIRKEKQLQKSTTDI